MTHLFAADLVKAEPLWRAIEQPMALKALVAIVGVALIAWELWWFLGRHGGGVVARESEAACRRSPSPWMVAMRPQESESRPASRCGWLFTGSIRAAVWPR